MNDTSRRELVQIVGKAPNIDWIDDFFDLLYQLLSYVELRDDDPRLVISTVRGDRIAVSMNSRYVLVAYPEEPAVGFIIRRGGKHTDELRETADGNAEFKALQGEHDDEPPYWVKFEGSPKNVLEGSICQHWLRASDIEFNRWTASPYRRFHDPLARKATTDKEYRERVLQEAFNSAE